MSTGINLGSLNGDPSVKWVISASAIAFAGLTSSVNASLFCSGNVYGDARSTVTLSAINTVAARATGLCDVNSSVIPTITRNSSSYALAGSFGSSSVWRNIAGNASADATAYGEGIASDFLGESLSNVSVSGLGTGFVIFGGKSNVFSEANGTVDSIAIRGTTATSTGFASGFCEASTQLFGESFTRLNGFLRATSTCTGFVRNDYTAIIATNGCFTFGDSSGLAFGSVIHAGRSISWSSVVANAYALRTTLAEAAGTAIAYGVSENTRIVFSSSLGIGVFNSIKANATINYSSSCINSSTAYAAISNSNINYSGRSLAIATALGYLQPYANHLFGLTNNTARATAVVSTANIIRYGVVTGNVVAYGTSAFSSHIFGLVNVSCFAVPTPSTAHINYASKSFNTGSSTGTSDYAVQHKTTSLNNVTSSGEVVSSFVNYAATSLNTGISLGTSVYAEHHKSFATNNAVGVNYPVTAYIIYTGSSLSTGVVSSSVTGFSNADVHAPESRCMIVSFDDRYMLSPVEDRNMVVEA